MRDTVDCPTCGSETAVGLPRDATVDRITPDPESADGGATARVATPACQACGAFAVVYDVERPGDDGGWSG